VFYSEIEFWELKRWSIIFGGHKKYINELSSHISWLTGNEVGDSTHNINDRKKKRHDAGELSL